MAQATRWLVLAAGMMILCALWPITPAAAGEPTARFGLAAWIPHWRGREGAARALEQLARFSHLSPFALRARADGSFDGPLQLARGPWPALRAAARARGVQVWPTVVWSDPSQRGPTLRDPARRQAHVAQVLALLEAHDLEGIDLDYERKGREERDAFSAFVRELAAALHARGCSLSCTLVPRTRSSAPEGVRGEGYDPWANDYAVLGAACDQVRLMAYDRSALAAEGALQRPAHAPLSWVRSVVTHARDHLDPRRVWLGVPTYGWELSPRSGGGFERMAALSFPDFTRRVSRQRLVTERSVDDEWIARSGRRTLVMSDARAVAQRVALAREAGLAGAILFKLDGLEDPALWRALDPG